MKHEERTKEVVVNVWVAEDGREFSTADACIRYEESLRRLEYQNKARVLSIKELDDIIPLDGHALPAENNNYRWYKIESPEDLDIVEKAYGDTLVDVESFPEIICVEDNGGVEFEGDAYGYTLHNIMLEAKDFFANFGYIVEFNK